MSANPVLADVLNRLQWSKTRLMNEINRIMGSGYISRSTISEWIHRGRVPHNPLPTVVAHVLSLACDEEITVALLWQGNAHNSVSWVSAESGLGTELNAEGVRATLHDWLVNSGSSIDLDRRTFLAASGTALTTPAWSYVDSASDTQLIALELGAEDGGEVSAGLVNVLSHTIHGLRILDDDEGAGVRNLRFVHRNFRTIAEYLCNGRLLDGQVERKLLSAWAAVSQLAGWMAFDAEKHGLAQRYYRTGLQATYAAGDRALGAHILACMSYQASYCGQLQEGVELANAAYEASLRESPVVRALVAARFGFAQAAIGNDYAYRSTAQEAASLLQRPDVMDDRPDWLYWFGPTALDVLNGQSLVTLGFATSRHSTKALHEGEKLLRPAVLEDDSALSPRDRAYHGAWVARSCARRGEEAEAASVASVVLRRLGSVESRRALVTLRALEHELPEKRSASRVSDLGELRDETRVALVA